jgi:Tol biopolymer transport system component
MLPSLSFVCFNIKMHTILFLLLSIILQARAIEKPLPKEGSIALCLRDAKGQLQIFTINPDGSQKRQLTFEGQNGLAAWSRDGKKIVFMSIRGPSGAQIFTMNADGSNQKLVTDGAAPDWSPDGKKILFSTGRNGKNELWVMNSDGTGQKRISDIDAGPFPGRASWQAVW